MADTGWKVAGTGTNVAAESGDKVWSTPSNITNETISEARAGELNAATQNLRATNFGFAVPAGMSISGVEVRIRRRDSSGVGDIRDTSVRLIAAGVAVGANKASAVKWTPTATTEDIEYGGSSDLWSTALTPAQVNANTFGVQLRASALVKGDACVQTIWMRVHYEEPGSFYEKVSGIWRKGQLSERVGGFHRAGKLYEKIGGIWRS